MLELQRNDDAVISTDSVDLTSSAIVEKLQFLCRRMSFCQRRVGRIVFGAASGAFEAKLTYITSIACGKDCSKEEKR